MANKNTAGPGADNFSAFGETHNYFIKNVLPNNIQAHKRSVRKATSYAHNKDQTFLLVKSGTGTLNVNGLDYPLVPNTLVNFGPFHIYRYLPDEGQVLELVESRMNSGSYMYLIANPYFKIPKLFIPSEPPVMKLRGILKDIANDAMDGLLYECSRNSSDRNSLCLCYMTDLFGIVTDENVRSSRREERQREKNNLNK